MQGFTGVQLVTSDIALGTSGKPVRIFSMHLISGGTASVVQLRAGTAVSGTIRIKETGTISTGKTFTYGKYGFLFETGCFVDVDANVVSVAIEYAEEI